MKKIIKYSFAIVASLFMASCVTTKTTQQFPPFDPTLQINVGVDDMEYLGETEISVEQYVYLGFIRQTVKVNGESFDSWKATTASLNGLKDINLRKATGKVLEAYPDADFYRVVSRTSEENPMFLSKHVTYKGVVKAYRLKY